MGQVLLPLFNKDGDTLKKAKEVEGTTEVKLEKPIENTVVLKANEKHSAASYKLIEDRVARLNAEWEGELKFVLIPYTVDIQE